MLKTTLVIAGDTDQGVKAVEQLDRGLNKVQLSAQDVGQAVSAAMQGSLQAIIENTAATNQSVAALVSATAASRQRADAANAQATAERAAAQAANDNARAEATLAQQAAALRAQIDPMYAAQQKFNQALDVAEDLLAKGIIQQGEYARAVEVARGALQEHAKAVAGSSAALDQASGKSKQAQAAYINLGRQMQDVAVMASMPGVNLGTIITTQGGQIADAVSQMGGRFAGLASFLSGPWGAAIIVGAGLLVNFAEKLFESGDAADKAKNAHETLADKLSLQKHSWEEVIAAMRDYNREAKKTAQSAYDVAEAQYKEAQASLNAALALRIKLAATLAADRKAMQTPTGPNGQGQLGASISAAVMEGIVKDNDARIAELREGVKTTAGAFAEQIGKVNSDPRYAIERRFQKAREEIKAAGGDLDVMAAKITKLDLQEQAELEAERKRNRKSKDNGSALANFGDSADTRIANITDQFSNIPQAVERANKAIRDLDDTIADVERKGSKLGNGPKLIADAKAAKATVQAELSRSLIEQIDTIGASYSTAPTAENKTVKSLSEISKIVDYVTAHSGEIINSDKILASAATAKSAIEDSLNKPFQDYLRTQAEQVSIDNLILAGRQDEADALRVTYALQKQQKMVTDDQADKVLEIVSAERQRNLLLRDQRALIQANIAGATGLRAALVETVSDTLKGRGSVKKIVDTLGNNYLNVVSQQFIESIFGDSLRAFEDAATRNFRRATEASGSAITKLGNAAQAAAAKISGSGSTQVGLAETDPLAQLFDRVLAKAGNSNSNGVPEPTGDGIVVNGRNGSTADSYARTVGRTIATPLTDKLNEIFGVSYFKKMDSILSGAVTGMLVAGPAGGVLGALKEIKGLPEGVSQGLSSAFKGVQTGTAVYGVSKSIGVNMSQTGAQVGGGIGAAVGAASGLPGGEIIGGIGGAIQGGLIGLLFEKSNRGTLVVNGSNSSVSASTNAARSGLTSSGDSIQSQLASIAQTFKTSVGDFSVSIGQYKDYFRVSASGSIHVGDKYYPNSAGADILYDGTDQAKATAIAIQNAIADGAIKGLSKAVQKALSGSSDLNAAVTEALKVQEVETAIGGIGASMAQAFREAAATADERVRIAKQYGFDLTAVEKANADDRLKLQKQYLQEQVGSLQQILDEMSSGSLFEGSAVDQRAAILAKITTAKADVAAGKDGASDTLAQLLEQLNTVSKEAFGSTAQYQADRAMIADIARDAIASANTKINDAQAMATAQAATNDALDEANDQLSRMAALMGMTVDYLKQLLDQGYISTSALADLAKTS